MTSFTLNESGWKAVTANCSYLETTLESATQAFLVASRRMKLQVECGTLDGGRAVATFMAPLTSPALRHSIVSLDGGWIALLSNQPYGDGRPSMAGILSRQLACRAITVCTGADDASPQLFVHASGELVRSIQCFKDGDRWFLHQEGNPLPFEDTARYELNPKRRRFDGDLLVRHCAQLGVAHPVGLENVRRASGVLRDAGQLRVPVLLCEGFDDPVTG